jgi:hypothetical protein
MSTHVRRLRIGRNILAQSAHFRVGAGAMGGDRRLQARRRRQKDRMEERSTRRDDTPATEG